MSVLFLPTRIMRKVGSVRQSSFICSLVLFFFFFFNCEMGKMVTGFPHPPQVLGDLVMNSCALGQGHCCFFIFLITSTCSVEDGAWRGSSWSAVWFKYYFSVGSGTGAGLCLSTVVLLFGEPASVPSSCCVGEALATSAALAAFSDSCVNGF